MEVVVDLTGGGVTVREPDDFERFAVRVLGGGTAEGEPPGSLERVAEILASRELGSLDPLGDVLVEPEALRRLAHTDSDLSEGWDERFAAMVERAESNGWTAPDGEIRAHLEWGR